MSICQKILDSFSFKLKSSKILFIVGVWITIVVVLFSVFVESENEGKTMVQESMGLFFDNVLKFFILLFVLLVNLYYNAKLIEGIIHRMPYKIIPWIVINAVNLVQAAIYFFKIDNLIGYLTLIVFCYIWMVVTTLYFEVKKCTREENMECTQQPSDVGYNNFSNPSDKQEA